MDPWYAARFIGRYATRTHQPEESEQRQLNAIISQLMNELEKRKPGTVRPRVGSKDPEWKAYYKKDSSGPINDQTNVCFTAQHVNGRVKLTFNLQDSSVEALHQTPENQKLYSEFVHNMYPMDPAGDERYETHIKYTCLSGERLGIMVTYQLTGTGKKIEFHSDDPVHLAEFLDIILGVDIKATVEDMGRNPHRYDGSDVFNAMFDRRTDMPTEELA